MYLTRSTPPPAEQWGSFALRSNLQPLWRKHVHVCVLLDAGTSAFREGRWNAAVRTHICNIHGLVHGRQYNVQHCVGRRQGRGYFKVSRCFSVPLRRSVSRKGPRREATAKYSATQYNSLQSILANFLCSQVHVLLCLRITPPSCPDFKLHHNIPLFPSIRVLRRPVLPCDGHPKVNGSAGKPKERYI